MKVDLSKYDNSEYTTGSRYVKRILWYLFNAVFFLNPFFPFSGIKVTILRMFGAKAGKGIVIKPRVNIKYPWRLSIGNFVWIGENVWIDNLNHVNIGDNCCLSQGAMLLCGSHNYKKATFDLITKPIQLDEGVWIGANAVVCPGVHCQSHAVLTVQSVATSDLAPFSIYQGNPAVKTKNRIIK